MPATHESRAPRQVADCAHADFHAARATLLDRLADIELQHGHHRAAERLAWQADALRGVAP